jgi:hypothetical protein
MPIFIPSTSDSGFIVTPTITVINLNIDINVYLYSGNIACSLVSHAHVSITLSILRLNYGLVVKVCS